MKHISIFNIFFSYFISVINNLYILLIALLFWTNVICIIAIYLMS
jgi:hypothetical protein